MEKDYSAKELAEMNVREDEENLIEFVPVFSTRYKPLEDWWKESTPNAPRADEFAPWGTIERDLARIERHEEKYHEAVQR